MIYLDTHVVVWMYAGQTARFPTAVRNLIETSNLGVSPMVGLELQYLVEIERIAIDGEPIIADLIDRVGLQIVDRGLHASCKEASRIGWTRDPFDRMIVAQASLDNANLLTKDRVIREHFDAATWPTSDR